MKLNILFRLIVLLVVIGSPVAQIASAASLNENKIIVFEEEDESSDEGGEIVDNGQGE